jgi:parvulin-like peptidyl-prolyl isomerase
MVSHILVRTMPSEEDMATKLALADSIYQAIMAGADFSTLATKYSVDENSRDDGGNLGWYAADDLLPEFVTALRDLEIDQVSPPVASEFGYHIIRLDGKRPSRPIDLEEDYDTIEEMTRRAKAQTQLEQLLDRVSAGLYIDKRL